MSERPDPSQEIATAALLESQERYYEARAAIYEQWLNREGAWDHGEKLNAEWRGELAMVEEALSRRARLYRGGQALDVAAGTGWWTDILLKAGFEVDALDTSTSMLELCRAKVGSHQPVRFVCDDVFSWEPDRRYRLISNGFWLSHIPTPLFQRYWHRLSKWLEEDGVVFFVDHLFNPVSFASNQEPISSDLVATRTLPSGDSYEIFKRFLKPSDLTEMLRECGWSADVFVTPHYFYYGFARRTPETSDGFAE